MANIELKNIDWDKIETEYKLREHQRNIDGLEAVLSRGTRIIKPGHGYQVLGLLPNHTDAVEAPISMSGLSVRTAELEAHKRRVERLKKQLH